MFGRTYNHQPSNICGLYYNTLFNGFSTATYLPQVDVRVHANILGTTSRTALKQTFVNPSNTHGIKQVRYMFPLYDGVSVVGFSCQVDNRTIVGEVKEKEKAKEVFRDAVARGETAGLFEQLPEASDVFTTTIGNIPPGARVIVNITYLGELKHDMEVDGIRYTIPTVICPRYGQVHEAHPGYSQHLSGNITITVDVEMPERLFIQKLQSPTHPIAMSMGTTSASPNAEPSMSKASATLSLGATHLETDFVLQVVAKGTGTPKAVLEAHPTIPNHRALMATLVPKFALPAEKPEVVFVCDQSGSMGGSRMNLAIEALQIFLKSLPVGVKFNICSFGNYHSFLWPRSVTYSQATLDEAVRHAQGLQANYGGTEMLGPLQATIKNRYQDMSLEVIMLTDGETWNQDAIFNYLNQEIAETKAPIRIFTLGIGSGVSHALIEGIAKAGNGFSQAVGEGEQMGSKVVRMLKGALSPHISDYTLEVKYSPVEKEDDDFEIVEKVADSLKVKLDLNNQNEAPKPKKPISLFDTSADPDQVVSPTNHDSNDERYAHLTAIPAPKILQAPQTIPSLFAFNRTTVYLLLGPDAPHATPSSVVLRGTSIHGPLELEMPIQILGTPGETIHQLAARKAISELEQGRGWLASAHDISGQLLKKRFDGRFSDMVEREAVRLGVQFQVGGKWCSFVAVEKPIDQPTHEKQTKDGREEWSYLEDEQLAQPTNSGRMQHWPPQAHSQAPVAPMNTQQLFGTKPSGGGLFGGVNGPQAKPSGGSLFGRALDPANMAMQQQQQQRQQQIQQQQQQMQSQQQCIPQAQDQGSLFGGVPPSGTTSGSSLFGGLGTPATFENPQFTGFQGNPGGSIFADPPTTKAFGQSTQGGSLFGASPAFGAPSQNTQGSSLFGASSGFGASNQNTQSVSLFGASSGFGASSQNNQSSSPFGSSPAPATSGLFGGRPQNSGSSLFGAPSAPAAAPAAASGTHPLQDYQMQCMLLEQQSKKRLLMARQEEQLGIKQDVAAPPPTALLSDNNDDAGDAPLENFDFDSFLHNAENADFEAVKTTTSPPPLPKNPTPQTLLHHLISLQLFSGAFPYHDSLPPLLGVSTADFARAAQSLSSVLRQNTDTQEILTTALVVVYVERKLQGLRGEWELVVEKAREWLGGECGGEEGRVEEIAGRLVGE